MRNGFDDEMKKRLYHYSEEPNEQLWKRIAPLVPQPNTTGSSGVHTKSLLGIIVVASILGLTEPGVEATDLDTSAASSTERVAKRSKDEIEMGQEFVTNLSSGTQAHTFSEIQSIPRRQLETEARKPNYFLENTSTVNEPTKKSLSIDFQGSQPTVVEELESGLIASVTIHAESGASIIEPQGVNSHAVTPTDSTIGEKPVVEKTKVTAATMRELAKEKYKANHRKFNFYLTAMPTFGYQRVKSNQRDNIIIESINKIPAFSVNRLGIRAEFGVDMALSKKVKVFGGLVYFQRKQTIDYVEQVVDTTYVWVDPDGNINLEPEYNHENKSFRYEVKNLGVQLGFNVILKKKKFLQTVGTGLELQMALNKINEAAREEGFTNNPSAYVFYNLYYRLQYPAEGRLKAVFQPTFNYSFYINQNLNAPFYVKPYGLGLNIGCTYSF